MSSAPFHLRPEIDAHEGEDLFDQQDADQAPFALRQQAAARLAEHRARRRNSAARTAPTPITEPTNSRAARIAATVAERYANSQSYRAFLAAEAEKAIHEAEAAAEVAARTARAVADAQFSLLAELDQWTLTPPPLPPEPEVLHTAAPVAAAPVASPAVRHSTAGLTIRPYEDHLVPSLHTPVQKSGNATKTAVAHPPAVVDPMDEEERLALDQEIEFRQDPVFEEPAGPPIDIPANLIHFPRQLVAARRARPRIAEGPLREEADHSPNAAQLRIFEVEPTQISITPDPEPVAPVWSSIVLDAHPAVAHSATQPAEVHYAATEASEYLATNQYIPSDVDAQATSAMPLLKDVASIELRLMAGMVDSCIILAGFLAFITAFALAAAPLTNILPMGPISLHNTTLQNAAIGSAVAIVSIAMLYQTLFFTFSDATPGMRYARIALCTFSDDNPTRKAMRRRSLALALSACPMGIGLLWAWLDNDRLSWHDRLTRMYQRSY